MEVVLALSAQPAGEAGGGDSGDAASGAAHGSEGAGRAARSTPSDWSMAPCLGACFFFSALGSRVFCYATAWLRRHWCCRSCACTGLNFFQWHARVRVHVGVHVHVCTQCFLAQRPEPMLHMQGAVQWTRGCWLAEFDDGMRIPSKALLYPTRQPSPCCMRGALQRTSRCWRTVTLSENRPPSQPNSFVLAARACGRSRGAAAALGGGWVGSVLGC